MEKEKKPFPQADDFYKVIKIINVADPSKIYDNTFMKMYLGDITDRQVTYYTSACQFLGILDNKKRFTEFGIDLRTNKQYQYIQLSQKIVSLDVFGEVYFAEKFLSTKLETEDIIDIMKKRLNINSYAVFKRRAQTVKSWVNWIDESINKYNNS